MRGTNELLCLFCSLIISSIVFRFKTYPYEALQHHRHSNDGGLACLYVNSMELSLRLNFCLKLLSQETLTKVSIGM